ncbi:MAG: CDP-alcohol phosphatidyltransferase family protein [Desulfobacterales bacterium]
MGVPGRLVNTWWKVAILSCCAVIGANLAIQALWQVPCDWRRFAGPLLPLVYVLAALRAGLPLNRRSGDTRVLDHLGAANAITMARGVLVSLLACFWSWPAAMAFSIHHLYAWLPGLIYIAAALLDLLDGAVARRSGHVTRLGERLDTRFDALGLLCAVLVGIGLNQLPLIYLAVALAYYVFTAGMVLRRRSGRRLAPLTPRPAARLSAGFTMGFVGAALLPLFGPPATTLAAAVFMVPFLAGFVRDWLVVSGRIEPGTEQPARWEELWQRLFRDGLPVALRAVLFVCALAAMEKTAAFSSGDTAGPFYAFAPFFRPVFLLAVVCAALGAAGRTAALPILLSSGLWISRRGADPLTGLLLMTAAGLLVAGSGNLSLWRPEEKFLGMSSRSSSSL